jgi:hypothetical protein
MILTNTFAKKNLGKYIDCFNRKQNHCGAYPRKLIQFPNGGFGTKDPIGVCRRIDERGFNVQYYDYLFDDLEVI